MTMIQKEILKYFSGSWWNETFGLWLATEIRHGCKPIPQREREEEKNCGGTDDVSTTMAWNGGRLGWGL